VGAQGLHAHQRQLAAFALSVVGFIGIGAACPRLCVVAAGPARVPLIDLRIGLPGRTRIGAADAQIGPGTHVVVVAAGVPPARQVVVRSKTADAFGISFPAGCAVVDLVVRGALALPVRAHVVDKHQAVPVAAVLEKVADAPFLAQAAEEVEVALVVLGLVVAAWVALDQALVYSKVIAAQQLIEYLHNGLVLVDPAVARQRGKVQPGAQREHVLNVAAFLAPHGRVGDECVDLAHAGTDVIDRCTHGAGQEPARTVELDRT
jgi:hypothetical protein